MASQRVAAILTSRGDVPGEDGPDESRDRRVIDDIAPADDVVGVRPPALGICAALAAWTVLTLATAGAELARPAFWFLLQG